MFNDLPILHDASARARHAAQRLAILSENVANADTPGYRAKDIEPFGDFVSRLDVAGRLADSPKAITLDSIPLEPNGNSVSIEDQMVPSAEAMRHHDIAITIYSKALGLLRAGLGPR